MQKSRRVHFSIDVAYYYVYDMCSGGSRGALPSQLDQILSFPHMFKPKSARVGGRSPPKRIGAPPTGNPGSAADVPSNIPDMFLCRLLLNYCYVSLYGSYFQMASPYKQTADF